MVRLRLFANLREAAGESELEAVGSTVGEVLADAGRRWGQSFAAGVEHAQVWVNGEPAQADTPVEEGDEVALIPPVSGGALAIRSPGVLEAALLVGLLAAVVVANALSLEVFIGVMVAVVGLWVWDVSHMSTRGPAGRQALLDPWPVLLAVLLGATIPYRFGLAGLGAVAAVVVMMALALAMLRPQGRSLPLLGATFAAGLLVALAVGSLVVIRLGPEGEERVNAFLLVVTAAVAARALLVRYPGVPLLDPLTGSSLAAVAFAAGAALLWVPQVLTMLLVGVYVAMALIAGRSFGSLLRVGEVYLIEPVPGTLAPLDGPLMAAAVLAPTLALLL